MVSRFGGGLGSSKPLPVADVPGLGGLVNWAGLGTPILRSGYDHPAFPEAALTIATMPARIASGSSGQAVAKAARSGWSQSPGLIRRHNGGIVVSLRVDVRAVGSLAVGLLRHRTNPLPRGRRQVGRGD